MTSIRLAGMTVESEGEGPPVIMLHGLGETSNSFQPLLPPLAGPRIVRPDLPGAGRSRAPPQQITVADQFTQSALSGATANDNPIAVAFCTREPYAPGCRRICPLLRGA